MNTNVGNAYLTGTSLPGDENGVDVPYRCVIADDHPAIIDSVARFLAEVDDVEVVARAHDGDEALRLIEELAPDVAVVDVHACPALVASTSPAS